MTKYQIRVKIITNHNHKNIILCHQWQSVIYKIILISVTTIKICSQWSSFINKKQKSGRKKCSTLLDIFHFTENL